MKKRKRGGGGGGGDHVKRERGGEMVGKGVVGQKVEIERREGNTRNERNEKSAEV